MKVFEQTFFIISILFIFSFHSKFHSFCTKIHRLCLTACGSGSGCATNNEIVIQYTNIEQISKLYQCSIIGLDMGQKKCCDGNVIGDNNDNFSRRHWLGIILKGNDGVGLSAFNYEIIDNGVAILNNKIENFYPYSDYDMAITDVSSRSPVNLIWMDQDSRINCSKIRINFKYWDNIGIFRCHSSLW